MHRLGAVWFFEIAKCTHTSRSTQGFSRFRSRPTKSFLAGPYTTSLRVLQPFHALRLVFINRLTIFDQLLCPLSCRLVAATRLEIFKDFSRDHPETLFIQLTAQASETEELFLSPDNSRMPMRLPRRCEHVYIYVYTYIYTYFT